MVAHLEAFRLKEFPIDDQIGHRVVYKRIVKLFVVEGVVDQSILELLVMIRKKKSQSKLIFDDCFISFSNQNKDIGVCRATNVEEFKKRIIDLLTTPDVFHQLLPPSVGLHHLAFDAALFFVLPVVLIQVVFSVIGKKTCI